MSPSCAVESVGLTKVFHRRFRAGAFRALDDVSLQVRPGAAYGLLGPNGAGKTTFVKTLLAATHPTAGSTFIHGRNSRGAEARRAVGYLPENHRFPTYLTGAGMLDFYAALSGMPSADRRTRVRELLTLVGLEDWGGVRLGKYSKGMLQRVGLAQALMHRPRLLVLDEPTDGVDPVGRVHIRKVLDGLRRDGVTIFVNSHLLSEVELFCEEVAILHRGRLRLTGKVAELTANQGYRLTTPPPADEVLNRLREMGAAVAANNGFVDLRFSTRDAANSAIDLLRAAQHPIEGLAQTRSTLEQVFMDVVEGQMG